MTYPRRTPLKTVVLSIPEPDVSEVRTEIRRHILEGTFSEALKEIMFELYGKLGEK